MTTGTEPDDETVLSPDDAFAVLGDETRLKILQTLAKSDGQLLFSELFDRIEYQDSSNFGYHLEKLVGHFVRKTDVGYDLRRTGRHVVEAVHSGAVTEDPVIQPSLTDKRCPYCSAPIEVGFQQERVEMYCTECPGIVRHEDGESEERFFAEAGTIGHMSLPPAGVQERTPTEVLEAAWTWKHLEVLANSTGVCVHCSGVIEHSVTVCADHDVSEGACDQCNRRYAVRFDVECPNCHYDVHGIAPARLLANTELLAFLTAHGINPLAPATLNRALKTLANYEEDVLSIDPFEATFSFTVDEESLTLTVDDSLAVVDVTKH